MAKQLYAVLRKDNIHKEVELSLKGGKGAFQQISGVLLGLNTYLVHILYKKEIISVYKHAIAYSQLKSDSIKELTREYPENELNVFSRHNINNEVLLTLMTSDGSFQQINGTLLDIGRYEVHIMYRKKITSIYKDAVAYGQVTKEVKNS